MNLKSKKYKKRLLKELIDMPSSIEFKRIQVQDCKIEIPPTFRDIFLALSGYSREETRSLLRKRFSEIKGWDIPITTIRGVFSDEVIKSISGYVSDYLTMIGLPSAFCVILQKAVDLFNYDAKKILDIKEDYQEGDSSEEIDLEVLELIKNAINADSIKGPLARNTELLRAPFYGSASIDGQIEIIYPLLYVYPNLIRQYAESSAAGSGMLDASLAQSDYENFKTNIYFRVKSIIINQNIDPVETYRNMFAAAGIGTFVRNDTIKKLRSEEKNEAIRTVMKIKKFLLDTIISLFLKTSRYFKIYGSRLSAVGYDSNFEQQIRNNHQDFRNIA